MKTNLFKLLLITVAIAIANPSSGQDALIQENIVFPADAGVINVTAPPYNADKTGVIDATAALQAAIDFAKGNLKGKIVYLPNGTYKVSNKLVFCTDAANHRGMILQGQSREGTIIKLADNIAPATVNLPVIKCVDGASFQNSMFNTNIQNLTVDIGSGNPGAVGINYLASNQGTVRNVLIKSSDPTKAGRNGLDITYSIPGPAMIKNVTVEGFDVGIRTARLQYGITFEGITLKGQRVAAIRNDAQTLSIRHLLSENTVPAIQQISGGQSKGIITILDSELKNGSSTNQAIQLDDGFLFARNIKTSGYAAALRSYGQVIPGNTIEEFVYDNTDTLFTSAKKSLNLNIRETPEIPLEDVSKWVSVRSFGAIPGDAIDDNAAIQAAMNSGASTIYFPNPNNSEAGSRYRISATITVPGTVKRILGLYTGMYPVGTFKDQSKPIFKFVDGAKQDTVILEGIRTASSGAFTHFVEQASSRTLVLRNISVRNGFGYRNSGFGDVYLEDFHTLAANLAYNDPKQQPGLIFKNQNVWARQLNPEQNSVNVINDGGTVWILGFKSEYPTTLVETKNGGKTELLGGFTLTKKTPDAPAFINDNSSVSVAGFGEARAKSTDAVYTSNIISETRGGITKYLSPIVLPTRKAEQDNTLSFVLPHYIGYPFVDTSAPVAIAQNVTVQLDSLGQGVTTASLVNNGSYDDDAIASLLLSKTDFTCENIGPNTVILTVTDNSGNTATDSAIVTVEDKIAPLAKAKNILVQLDASGNASLSAEQVNDDSSDACGIQSLVLSKTNFTCENIGQNTVTLTVTDSNGNVATDSAIVIVEDKIAPVVFTQNINVTLINGSATITPAAIDSGSYDACGIKSLSLDKSVFDCANVGNNTVTLTVTDNNDNVSSATAIVNVIGVKPQVVITVSKADNTFTGLDVNTIALGYGAQSVLLAASASGSNTMSYVWSPSQYLDNAASANPVFKPTATGVYTFNVTGTNEFGCSASAVVTLTVIDVRCGNKNDKVLVCHKNKSAGTNCISANAVDTHLRNGGSLGVCATGLSAGNLAVAGSAEQAVLNNELSVSENSLAAYPNPFSKQTRITFKLITGEENVSLDVYDLKGLKAATIYSGKADANKEYTFNFESPILIPGMYILRLSARQTLLNFKIIYTP